MRIKEVEEKLKNYTDKPFGELFPKEELEAMTVNKGRSGQLLELLTGLPTSSAKTTDCEDGEIKSTKVDKEGNPKETMSITIISSNRIDNLLNGEPFYDSPVGKKLENLLYVPVAKEGTPENWSAKKPIFASKNDKKFAEFYEKLEEDYNAIVKAANSMIATNGQLHTLNGPNKLLQIRTKDSKPYHPIYSEKYGKEVSNKNRAFFLRKEALRCLSEIADR